MDYDLISKMSLEEEIKNFLKSKRQWEKKRASGKSYSE